MPAYIGNGHPQFFPFIELAGGDDEKVLVENPGAIRPRA